MERAYSTGIAKNTTFFVGDEIEHTPALGMRTLFVVGLQDFLDITIACTMNRCDHIYLGANQSYKPESYNEVHEWDELVTNLLNTGLWVTLDIDNKFLDISSDLLACACSYDQFIPMLSFKVPYIRNLNYNACVKIDDKGFRATNPGVWVHHLHDLMDRGRFTDWSKYGNDVIVDDNTVEARETGNE
jgi:hypothetical protein